MHVGLIGVGRIGAFHARTLSDLEHVSALTIADVDETRAAQVAGELGAATASSPEALFESPPDAVVIATPTPAHASLIRLAAAAGVPAFCEKPIALDLAELDGLIADVDAAGTLVQVGFQRRFDHGYRTARDAVEIGSVGTLLALRAATHDPAPPPEAYIERSGGIFRDLHIHDLDVIRFVSGLEIEQVYADGSVRAAAWFARQGDVDTAAAVLRLTGGVLAVLTGTRHDPLGYDVRLEVFGTGDSIAVGLDRRTPLRSVERDVPYAGSGYRDFVERFQAAYRAELETFVETVRAGGESACTLREARAALVAAIAADRSRATGRPVATSQIGAGS